MFDMLFGIPAYIVLLLMGENGETVQVALRIRPLVESEIARGCQVSLSTVADQPQVQVLGTDKAFTFNHVFCQEDSQAKFYDTAIKDLVSRLFKGYNVTILAYGQTGSGKTYSIGTCYTGQDDMGVIPRAIADIFSRVKEMEDWNFKISVSFMELYQEQLFDLLAPTRCVVDLREDSKGIVIPGLTEVPVKTAEDMTACLVQGSAGRATGATAMNSQSSRSHAIFTVNIEQVKLNNINEATSAKFHLVDLAGSERSKKTKATGERFKEGVNINRGLLALGNVISALGDGTQSFISYRDSKLTRLLQDSLGGNSLTLMIACVSPADYNLQETLSTLRYADRARHIKNKPIINQDPQAAEISRLKQQLQEMRLLMIQGGGDGTGCPPEHTKLLEENLFLRTKANSLTEQLGNLINQNLYLVERAHLAEQARARMHLKVSELQAEYDLTMDELNLTLQQVTCPAEFVDQLRKLSGVQKRIKEIQEEQRRGEDELLTHELSQGTVRTEGLDLADEQDIAEKREVHTMQQAKLNNELQELNRALALKEELASQLTANLGQITTVREEYERNQALVETLKKEKDELQQALRNVHVNNSSNKMAEQRRKQVQELELKIANLTKKIQEQANIIKMKGKSDEKITILQNEIQTMKQIKVRLIRQMKAESEKFKLWKQERERELIKLKDQDRKRQNQIVKMERLHAKQQNVLKRKVEEAVAINKRLKDALALQKSVQDRRHKGDNMSKVQTWVSHELEVLVSTVAAERSLEELVEDRAIINSQLSHLKQQVQSGNLSKEELVGVKEDMKQLGEDLELRSAQIADLQQKIDDSDQENKTKTRWDTLQSMGEAKIALVYLFDVAAEVKRDVASKTHKLAEIEEALKRAEEKLAQDELELREVMSNHKEEIHRLEKEHQNKLFLLLRQLNGSGAGGDTALLERIKILEAELEHMEELQRLLEDQRTEVDKLRNLLDQRTAELEKIKQITPTKNKTFKNKAKPGTSHHTKISYTANHLDIDDDKFQESFEDDDNEKDPDWMKTPLFKKLQNLKYKDSQKKLHFDSSGEEENTDDKENSENENKKPR
uniref:Kinesin motor domain-containing protein n=2 Tax=Timema TaxID=61471 RepID=A0A7R9JSG5_TIMGE|nr:unnamed protein product [Timema genevievae]